MNNVNGVIVGIDIQDKTPFVGYETLSGDSEILAVVVDGEKKQP